MGTSNVTTTGTITAATNSKLGDITISDGSITSETATISMGTNNITTSGTITAATDSKLGDITIADGSITSDTATISMGTNNVQTSGSIEAGSATLTSDLTVGGNFVIGSESISESTIGSVNGVTLGQSADGKVVTQGLTGDINLGTSNGSNIIKVLSHNGVDAGLQLGSTLVEATADLNKLSGITDGQVTAEKAIVVDSSSDIVGINNITSTGKITSQEQETINSTITNGLKLDVATKSFSDATKLLYWIQVLMAIRYIPIHQQEPVLLLMRLIYIL